MKRIYAAGLETESNSFSPIPTGEADFVVYGHQPVFKKTHGTLMDLAMYQLWEQMASDRGDQLISGFYAAAEPSGLTVRSAYEFFRDTLLKDLESHGSVDVVLLFLHGAMMAQGYDDCEGDLLRRIREHVGPHVVIAVELDLHCHLTHQMLDNSTVLISFKEYPHTDIHARAEELFSLAMDAAGEECKPVMAVADCHMVGMYPTTTPAMRGFIDEMTRAEQEEEILSVSFIHGFPYGDMPEAGGKILVVANRDKHLATKKAQTLAEHIISLRNNIGFASLPLSEALPRAVQQVHNKRSGRGPVVVADQSDNAGGGAPSDATFSLRWLLEAGIQQVACALFYDPQVVKLAITAGVGASLLVRLGGKMGITSGDPLDLEVSVLAIQRDYQHQFPQERGDPVLVPAGDAVALHCRGIDIVVSSLRCQCFCPSVFDDFSIPAKERHILVVKSAQHFYSAFAEIASDIIYMAAPGAVPPVVTDIPYQKMSTEDKYPWLKDPLKQHIQPSCL